MGNSVEKITINKGIRFEHTCTLKSHEERLIMTATCEKILIDK